MGAGRQSRNQSDGPRNTRKTRKEGGPRIAPIAPWASHRASSRKASATPMTRIGRAAIRVIRVIRGLKSTQFAYVFRVITAARQSRNLQTLKCDTWLGSADSFLLRSSRVPLRPLRSSRGHPSLSAPDFKRGGRRDLGEGRRVRCLAFSLACSRVPIHTIRSPKHFRSVRTFFELLQREVRSRETVGTRCLVSR